ncbi:MAG: peptide-binding protein [Planctomycetaceae bacterium]|nr:peptide-binding protein [Planctomycetaceae bacterium]
MEADKQSESSDSDTTTATNSDGAEPSTDETTTATKEGEENKPAEQVPGKLKNSLIDQFDPPSLEELNASVTWKDMPVLDGMELMRERQAKEEVLATVEEAKKLKNDSDEANKKIISAMGRGPTSESEVDYEAVWNHHVGSDAKSTNPLMASSTIEFDVGGLTGFDLFSFDWNFTPFGNKETIVSWQSSEDGLYDKVVMRDDLVWSDGKPITAHDVVYSFRTIMDPRVPVPAARSGTDQIKWIEAYDDHTLVYFHKESLATNIWNIIFPIIPKHVYEPELENDPTLQNSEYFVNLEKKPVVGGRYELVSRDRNQEMVLERREDWYMHDGKQVREKPHFKQIRMKIINDPNTALLTLIKGDIDEMQLNSQLWETNTNGDDFYENNTKVSVTEWGYGYFGWNNKTPYFEDKRVREAMSYAFDHKELLDEYLYGLYEPATGIFHPESWMAPKKKITPYTQNLDKAEELLDAAGWVDSDNDGVRDKEINGKRIPFEFTILCVNSTRPIDFCTLLKSNLETIGIICNVSPLEFTVLQEKTRTHKFHAALGGWGSGADPSTNSNLWTTKAIDEGRNFVNYSNPKVDQLFEDAERAMDRDKRAEIYGKIHELIWEDQPYTFLYYSSGFYGFKKTMRGYVFSPRGPFHYSPGMYHLWKSH